ncbi:hypothetical protein FACS189472_13860 [Alphaproteobacteria bacterium]|nr:hypothetical protein FACS189472_13860 [Alphaproteobacteria bacterium]
MITGRHSGALLMSNSGRSHVCSASPAVKEEEEEPAKSWAREEDTARVRRRVKVLEKGVSAVMVALEEYGKDSSGVAKPG